MPSGGLFLVGSFADGAWGSLGVRRKRSSGLSDSLCCVFDSDSLRAGFLGILGVCCVGFNLFSLLRVVGLWDITVGNSRFGCSFTPSLGSRGEPTCGDSVMWQHQKLSLVLDSCTDTFFTIIETKHYTHLLWSIFLSLLNL